MDVTATVSCTSKKNRPTPRVWVSDLADPGNEAELLDLFRAAFGHEMPPELWRWKYQGLDTLGTLVRQRRPTRGFLWGDATSHPPVWLPGNGGANRRCDGSSGAARNPDAQRPLLPGSSEFSRTLRRTGQGFSNSLRLSLGKSIPPCRTSGSLREGR